MGSSAAGGGTDNSIHTDRKHLAFHLRARVIKILLEDTHWVALLIGAKSEFPVNEMFNHYVNEKTIYHRTKIWMDKNGATLIAVEKTKLLIVLHVTLPSIGEVRTSWYIFC